MGVLALIRSDYVAAYAPRREPRWRLRLLLVPRLLVNPELHATALLRLALASPRITRSLWRSLLIAKHGIDVQGDVEIGPGLRLPHPTGLVLGRGLVIGRDVTLYHDVVLGSRPTAAELRRLRRELPHVINPSPGRPCPTIEDDVIILGGSWVLGAVTVGRGALVGARSYLDRDLPAGAIHVDRR